MTNDKLGNVLLNMDQYCFAQGLSVGVAGAQWWYDSSNTYRRCLLVLTELGRDALIEVVNGALLSDITSGQRAALLIILELVQL